MQIWRADVQIWRNRMQFWSVLNVTETSPGNNFQIGKTAPLSISKISCILASRLIAAPGQRPDPGRDASGFTGSSEPAVLYLKCIKTVSALFNTKGDTHKKQTGYIQMKIHNT